VEYQDTRCANATHPAATPSFCHVKRPKNVTTLPSSYFQHKNRGNILTLQYALSLWRKNSEYSDEVPSLRKCSIFNTVLGNIEREGWQENETGPHRNQRGTQTQCFIVGLFEGFTRRRWGAPSYPFAHTLLLCCSPIQVRVLASTLSSSHRFSCCLYDRPNCVVLLCWLGRANTPSRESAFHKFQKAARHDTSKRSAPVGNNTT